LRRNEDIRFIPVIFISSLMRQRIYKVIDLVKTVDASRQAHPHQRSQRSPGGGHLDLPAGSRSGRRSRSSFITQVGQSPGVPRFFLYEPKLVDDICTSVLENKIRGTFTFRGSGHPHFQTEIGPWGVDLVIGDWRPGRAQRARRPGRVRMRRWSSYEREMRVIWHLRNPVPFFGGSEGGKTSRDSLLRRLRTTAGGVAHPARVEEIQPPQADASRLEPEDGTELGEGSTGLSSPQWIAPGRLGFDWGRLAQRFR